MLSGGARSIPLDKILDGSNILYILYNKIFIDRKLSRKIEEWAQAFCFRHYKQKVQVTGMGMPVCVTDFFVLGMVVLFYITQTTAQTWHLDVFGQGYYSIIIPLTDTRCTAFAAKKHQVH
jgi:hypothetical protein